MKIIPYLEQEPALKDHGPYQEFMRQLSEKTFTIKLCSQLEIIKEDESAPV